MRINLNFNEKNEEAEDIIFSGWQGDLLFALFLFGVGHIFGTWLGLVML